MTKYEKPVSVPAPAGLPNDGSLQRSDGSTVYWRQTPSGDLVVAPFPLDSVTFHAGPRHVGVAVEQECSRQQGLPPRRRKEEK